MIKIKRAYEPPHPEDGTRFLVDRFWPRGVTKDAIQIAAWLKDAAPGKDLCHWFGHDAARWDEFRRLYTEELDANPAAWQPILDAARQGTVTLVYGARDADHNNAVALQHYLETKQS
jgi:uncharacterized protein YeaO (DUF488 family)